MKKYIPLDDNEIDLSILLKIIWDGKIKILLITIILFILGFAYNYLKPTNYLISLTLSNSNYTEFTKINNIKKMIQLNETDGNESNVSNQLYLVEFIDEIMDYEEFLYILKNIKKIQKNLSGLNIEDQEKKLYEYAKSLEIVEIKNNVNYIINFKWHDPDEAKKILQDTLYLVSENLKKLTDLKLSKYLEFKKKLLLNNDRVRLNYLKEQSAIAKELQIVDNQIDNVNLTTQSSVSLSINTADIAYYLRGYKAIDKEIELIQNRDYRNLEIVKQEIDSFKKDNVKWANYNFYLMDVKSTKNTKLILVISILLGLIVGVFYVLLLNKIQSQIASRKTRSR